MTNFSRAHLTTHGGRTIVSPAHANGVARVLTSSVGEKREKKRFRQRSNLYGVGVIQ